MIYAVIDTNVIVSALISKNPESATVKVFEAFLAGNFKILFNDEILEEYLDVLSRSKFRIPEIMYSENLYVKRKKRKNPKIAGASYMSEEWWH